MSNNKKIENFKIASSIFSEFKDTLIEVLKNNPELVEDALRKRNTQIKCLRADIEHRQVVFKEINERYDTAIEEIDKLKIDRDLYKSLYEKIKLEKESFEQISLANHKLYTEKTEAYNLLKREKEKLEKELTVIDNELNKSKSHLAIVTMERKKTVKYKITQLIDHMPNGNVKSITQFLFSNIIYKYTLFFIFMLLLFTSIFGWGQLIELVKQVKEIF